MQEHLSDCSPHYACLCVTLGKKKGSEERGREQRVERGGDIECLHLIPVTGHLLELQYELKE